MRVLVVNAGSSSLKLRILGDDDRIIAASDAESLTQFVNGSPAVDAVGHRVVHGGTEFTDPAEIDEDVLRRLDALAPLAPLHQPRAIELIREARSLVPGVPHVACFDTAFHATIPDFATTYALPSAWRERWPVRKFGFHGLSHAYAARRAAEDLGRTPGTVRVVTCHLGAGASLCAVCDGRSVDTTMGMTPLDGVVMATRAGAVDPGLLVWLQQEAGMSVDELEIGLEDESGLLGLAGTSNMREVLARRAAGDERARLAFDVYVHRLRQGIAAMAVSVAPLDALVFTGGVGEH
ncbi:MAG TPA: acetate/propionate family kinase, partial [Acidimicrobiia bacterium]|nr:acetate/propionate family kinase [Acidimicrobiia bacterium]